jgi:hypothetical protein
VKPTNSFILSLTGLACLTAMCVLKGVDTSTAISLLVGGYVASRSGEKASNVWAASKDKDCSTAEVIEKLK